MRLYAVGDIHGRLDLLERLQASIAADAAPAPLETRRRIVYLGDYIDRGPDSRGVLDTLIRNPLEGFEPIHLMGNHEDMMLRFLENPGEGPLWLANGGDAMVESYGLAAPRHFSAAGCAVLSHELREALPRAHLQFLRGLRRLYEAQDYVFVHAGVRPGLLLEAQNPEDLIWIRQEFLRGPGLPGGRIVVHGHTPERTPGVHAHRIGIDTGAFATDILTCVVLEGTSRRFLST